MHAYILFTYLFESVHVDPYRYYIKTERQTERQTCDLFYAAVFQTNKDEMR